MINETKNITVPKLRFEEFEKEGEWVHSTVQENCLLKGRIGYRGYTTEDLVEKDNGALVLGGKHIQNHALDLSEPTFLSWDKYYESPEIMAEIGDIIFSQRGTLGDCAIIEKEIGPATINPSMVLLKNITCNAKFLYYILIGDSIQKEVQKNRALGAIPMLSQKQIKEFPFLIPINPKEQQKIADCLSSLDDIITAENQKLQVLKVHKKGLMQQLFPAEGETLPKLRFEEFRNLGEWVEKELGELIEIKGRIGYRGYTVEDIVNKGEGAITLSPSNINAAGTLSFEKSTYISWAKYEESPEIMLDEGFTVLVKTGSTFGKAALIKKLPVKSTINPQFVVLKPIKINSVFLFLIITNSSIQRQINETVVGGAIPTLSQESISKFEVLIPLDQEKKEQQKIADCLFSLEELIIAQTEKIEILKIHKKGLMQGLFSNSISTR
ncbi:MAG: restriction endonuclease subunit S [Saprospiraceae bacterium]